MQRYKIYKYVAFDGCCDKFSIITTLQKGFAGLLSEQKIDICFSISLWGRMSKNIRGGEKLKRVKRVTVNVIALAKNCCTRHPERVLIATTKKH